MAAEEERGRVHHLSKTAVGQMKYDIQGVLSHGAANAIGHAWDPETVGKADEELIETYQICRSQCHSDPEPGT
jgi:hypothetical protein